MIFRFKKKINLKTKYKNESECLNNCRDIKHKTYKNSLFSEKISGEVNLDKNTFKLSSQGVNASNVVFNGEVNEDKGTIFMKGEIKPKLTTSFILNGTRVIVIYTFIKGLIDIYTNRTLIGNLYDSIFLLIVVFLALYFLPQLAFYVSYNSLINNLNKRLNL